MNHRILAAIIALGLGTADSIAAPITLQSNVTNYPYLQPNVGANLATLLTPGAYFTFGDVDYGAFAFSGNTANAPSTDKVWIVFNPYTIAPLVVVDPSVIPGPGNQVSFNVGWTVTANPSMPFSSTTLSGTDFNSGTGDFGPAGTKITQTVFSTEGSQLGTQNIGLCSGGASCPAGTFVTLHFSPQTSLAMSFLVEVTGDARFTSFGASTVAPLQVPEPGALIVSLTGATALACVSLPRRKQRPPRGQI